MGLNVELLEHSFELVAPKGEALVDVFYNHLFEDYPAVRPLFEDVDMQDQRSRLLASLVLVVANLRAPEELAPTLELLGQRHTKYGAIEVHYPAVGATLVKSLAEIAGEHWNDELEQAWSDAYDEISAIMLSGTAVVSAT